MLYNSLQIKFLILIAIVCVITAGFAILIFRQMKVVGNKALEAKKRQNEHQTQLEVSRKIKSDTDEVN